MEFSHGDLVPLAGVIEASNCKHLGVHLKFDND